MLVTLVNKLIVLGNGSNEKVYRNSPIFLEMP